MTRLTSFQLESPHLLCDPKPPAAITPTNERNNYTATGKLYPKVICIGDGTKLSNADLMIFTIKEQGDNRETVLSSGTGQWQGQNEASVPFFIKMAVLKKLNCFMTGNMTSSTLDLWANFPTAYGLLCSLAQAIGFGLAMTTTVPALPQFRERTE